MSFFDRHRKVLKDDVKSGDLPSLLPEQKSHPSFQDLWKKKPKPVVEPQDAH